MAARFPRIKNYHISIKEINNKIIFLRKLEEGGSEHSFGIHVAKMAGMPGSVLERAEEMLRVLEAKAVGGRRLTVDDKQLAVSSRQSAKGSGKKIGSGKQEAGGYQLSFIQLNDPLLEQIRDEILKTDINTLTPVEALMKLNEIKKVLGGK
jgi:DNA mismatch repair protein MutS